MDKLHAINVSNPMNCGAMENLGKPDKERKNTYRGSKGKASVKSKVLSLDKKDKCQIKENIKSVWVRLPPKGIKDSVGNKEEALGFKRKTSGTMLSVSQEKKVKIEEETLKLNELLATHFGSAEAVEQPH